MKPQKAEIRSMHQFPECREAVEPAPPGKRRAKRTIRLLIRFAALAAMVLLLAGMVAPWPWASLIVPALSPYVLISAALAGRTLELGLLSGEAAWWSVGLSRAAVVGLPVLLFVLVSRRGFCRFACPVGLTTEPLRRVCPSAQSRFTRLPRMGRWIVLATWTAAILGYPLAIWLDPLAILGGAFTLRQDAASAAGWAAVAALLLIAIAAVFLPNVWCPRVCPLGASQDLLFLGARAAMRPVRRLKPKSSPDSQTPRISRRTILSLAAGGLAAGGGAGVACWVRAGTGRPAAGPIRPPGAAGEQEFPWLCARCGNCVRVCPEGILHADLAPGTVFGYLAPVVRFESGYCKEDCNRCTEVCPSGAIAPVAIEEKRSARMGLARVDMSLCLLSPENGERECAICRGACPYQAIKMEFDWDTYVTSPRVDPQKCPGCGACEAACPAMDQGSRRKAIFVVS